MNVSGKLPPKLPPTKRGAITNTTVATGKEVFAAWRFNTWKSFSEARNRGLLMIVGVCQLALPARRGVRRKRQLRPDLSTFV
jgi:hypothetical protein